MNAHRAFASVAAAPLPGARHVGTLAHGRERTMARPPFISGTIVAICGRTSGSGGRGPVGFMLCAFMPDSN